MPDWYRHEGRPHSRHCRCRHRRRKRPGTAPVRSAGHKTGIAYPSSSRAADRLNLGLTGHWGCPNQRQQRVGKRSRPWLLTPMTAWNVRLQPDPTPLPTFGIESYRSPLEMNISGTIRVAVGRYHLGHHTKAVLGCTTGSGEHSRCAVPWGLGLALAPHARQPGLLLDW